MAHHIKQVPLSILLVTCAICSVIVTVKTFQVNFGVAPPNTPLPQDSNSVNTPKVPVCVTSILIYNKCSQ